MKVLKDKINLKRTAGYIVDESDPSFKEYETIYINHYEEKLHFAMKYKNPHLIESVTPPLNLGITTY